MVREVVTIDISNFEERKHEIAKQLFEAAKDVGFFYISGAASLSRSSPQYLPLWRVSHRHARSKTDPFARCV